ncbi:MAG TPA: hypothetical protein DCY86_14310 [Bdellovibrionales bacterium]|nr:hypothetical protein [Bdellovibrionales bacterium]
MLASLDLWLLLKEPLAGEPQADVLRGFGLMVVQSLEKAQKTEIPESLLPAQAMNACQFSISGVAGRTACW